MEKNKRIKKELDRLNSLFSDVDGNQRAAVTPLLQNAAFMRVTLEDLQEIILRDGAIEVYQNGANQHGVKQSAAVQSYNSLIKNYAGVIKTLAGLLPPERKKDLVPIKPLTSDERDKLNRIEKMYEEEHLSRIRAESELGSAKQKIQRMEWAKEGRL